MDKIQEAQEELLSFEKALAETYQRLVRFEVKANDTLKVFMQQSKRASLFFDKDDLYEVHLAGERQIFPLSYVNDTLRINKAKYDLWIDQERREVRVRGKLQMTGNNVYKLLVHIAKNVGKWYSRAEIFKEVWEFKLESDDPTCKQRVEQIFSRYIYKFGRGVLRQFIRAEKGGYRIQDDLKSCVICKKAVLQDSQ